MVGASAYGVYVSTPPLGPSLQAEGPHYLTLHGTGAVVQQRDHIRPYHPCFIGV